MDDMKQYWVGQDGVYHAAVTCPKAGKGRKWAYGLTPLDLARIAPENICKECCK